MVLILLHHQLKKGFTVSGRMTYVDYLREIGLLIHSRGKEEYIWSDGDPKGPLLVSPYWWWKSLGNCNRSIQAGWYVIRLLVMWVTLPCKEPIHICTEREKFIDNVSSYRKCKSAQCLWSTKIRVSIIIRPATYEMLYSFIMKSRE